MAGEKQSFELLPNGNSFCLIGRLPISRYLVVQHCVLRRSVSSRNSTPNRISGGDFSYRCRGVSRAMETFSSPPSFSRPSRGVTRSIFASGVQKQLNLSVYLIRIPCEWPRERVMPVRNSLEQKGPMMTMALFSVWGPFLSRKVLPNSFNSSITRMQFFYHACFWVIA